MKKIGKAITKGTNILTGGKRRSKNASSDVSVPSHTPSPTTSAHHSLRRSQSVSGSHSRSSDSHHITDATYEGEDEEEEESMGVDLDHLIDEIEPAAAKRNQRSKAAPSSSRLPPKPAPPRHSTSSAAVRREVQPQHSRQLQHNEEQSAHWYNFDTSSGSQSYAMEEEHDSEEEEMELLSEEDDILAHLEVDREKTLGKAQEGVSYGRGHRQKKTPLIYPECLTRRVVASRYGCEKTIEELGIKEAVEKNLKKIGLWNILFTPQPTYPAITQEFFATLEKTKVRGCDALRFAIMGNMHTLTSTELNAIFAPSPEEAIKFDDGLLEREVSFDYVYYWQAYTGREDYNAGRSKTAAISNPQMRYVQKVLANTIVGRYDNQGSISQKDMLVLISMQYKRYVDLGVLLIDHMKSIPYKSSKPFVMGGFVTSIALALGYDLSEAQGAIGAEFVDLNYLTRSHTIKIKNKRMIYLATSVQDFELELPYHAKPLLSTFGPGNRMRENLRAWQLDHPRETFVREATAAHEDVAESNVQGQEHEAEEERQPRRTRRRDEGTSQLQPPAGNAYDMATIQAHLENIQKTQGDMQLVQQYMWQDQQQMHYQINHLYQYQHAQAARNPEWGADFWGGIAGHPQAYPPPQDDYWGHYYQHPPSSSAPDSALPPDPPQIPDQPPQP